MQNIYKIINASIYGFHFPQEKYRKSKPNLVPDQYPKYSPAKNMFDNFFKTR